MYGQNINVSQPVTTYSIYGYVLALYTYGPVNIGMRLRVGHREAAKMCAERSSRSTDSSLRSRTYLPPM